MRLTLSTAAIFGFVCAASTSGLGPRVTTEVDDDPCTRTAANRSEDLSNWVECQVNSFFPFPANGAWDVAYDAAFSRDVLASWNETKFDFDGFKALYTSFNETIGRNFIDFRHAFIKTLGVPNSSGGRGGFAYLTGWEGGLTALGTELYAEDAAFAVVEETPEGKRVITEFREASNMMNTAPVPKSQDWTCRLL
ncbi:hypothetical protein DL768_001149 [Monosporascus sp. mg162]|nr:hypothetical protein DL768_001149 [Monosporascus sp. mg162]